MEATKNSLALVLNRQAYRERDSLVNVYTAKWGKLPLIARGTQKLGSKLAGHIEPLSLVNLMIVRGKGLDYIGSSINSNSFLNIRQDLNKLYYAGEALNIFNRLTQADQADDELFNLLTEYLQVVNDISEATDKLAEPSLAKDQGELLLNGFTWQLLNILGYRPELYHCLTCRESLSPGINYFDLLNGGLVCATCWADSRTATNFTATNFQLCSDNCLKAVRFLTTSQPKSFTKLIIDQKTGKDLSLLTRNFLKFCN
jgi:DNA repair protein RecO (recombination protein O)